MKHTNINIKSPVGFMKYHFEYRNDTNHIVNGGYHYTVDQYNRRVDFYNLVRADIRRDNNIWFIDDPELFVQGETEEEKDQWYEQKGFFTNYIPHDIHISRLYLYFPRFSVETYVNYVKYALDISIYIHGHEVHLGSYLIDRNDVLATDKVKVFNNEEYYEYLAIDIIDPWYITYSDEWKSFRQQVCEERDVDGYEVNSTGSLINISFHPVELSDTYHNERYDTIQDGETIQCIVDGYHEINTFYGGQNSINISDEESDYLSFHIRDNRHEVSNYDRLMVLETAPKFNRAYTQDIAGFREYIKETYNIDDFKLSLEIAIGDEDDLYSYVKMDVDSPWQRLEFKTLHDSNNNRPLVFDSWNNYHEGMFIKSFLHIDTGDDDSLLYLQSNQIPVTKDLFRYMVTDDYVFKRFQKDITSTPIFVLHGHQIRITGDNVYVDDEKQQADADKHIFVEDVCFTVQEDDPCVKIGTRKITIVGNTFTITDQEGNVQILQPDENGYIQIDGGQVDGQDDPDPNHRQYFRLTQDGKAYQFEHATETLGIIEIYDGKVILNGVSQFVNDAGYVWLKDVEGARFDINSSDGYTYLSGRRIYIDQGNIIWGGRTQPIYYEKPSSEDEYPFRNGVVYIDKCIISKVYLDAVDMKVYNINAVNKIQQSVVKMDRVDDHKTNIIKPVFFRAYELGKVVFHPAVVENICINLDQYKAKVDKFVLKLEGCSFTEIGRTSAGVIFKIDGRSLPNMITSGLYYILNSSGELVTTGKYMYEE